MKIALVHDFLIKLGGAERVLKVLSDMFPKAPIYTLLYDEEICKNVFPKELVRTSFLHNYPKFIRKNHRFLTLKMPRAVEEFNFDEFDLVISSNSSFVHGLICSSKTKHLCYCHSPMRYAWDWANEYKKENHISGLKKLIYAPVIKQLRMWDKIASDRPDAYLANSINVQQRIQKYYQLKSNVVYPPVDTSRFSVSKKNHNFFLIVSTLTPYKRIDLAIELFNKLNRNLVIIGSGSHMSYLKSIAGKNIEFLGFKSDEIVKEYMETCRAFIFSGEDDFGITPVEAMACGKPVLAFGRGGALETIIPGQTGEFFYEASVESMEDSLARLLYNERFYNPNQIKEHALKFDTEIFKKNIRHHIRQLMSI